MSSPNLKEQPQPQIGHQRPSPYNYQPPTYTEIMSNMQSTGEHPHTRTHPHTHTRARAHTRTPLLPLESSQFISFFRSKFSVDTSCWVDNFRFDFFMDRYSCDPWYKFNTCFSVRSDRGGVAAAAAAARAVRGGGRRLPAALDAAHHTESSHARHQGAHRSVTTTRFTHTHPSQQPHLPHTIGQRIRQVNQPSSGGSLSIAFRTCSSFRETSVNVFEKKFEMTNLTKCVDALPECRLCPASRSDATRRACSRRHARRRRAA